MQVNVQPLSTAQKKICILITLRCNILCIINFQMILVGIVHAKMTTVKERTVKIIALNLRKVKDIR